MLVSYLTTYDAHNIHSWSGTGYNIPRAIEGQGIRIDYVGNLPCKFENFFKLKQLGYRLIGKQYLRDREPYVARHYSKKALQLVNPSSDILFSPGTSILGYLYSNKPKVIYTDATFANMIGYYGYFDKLCRESVVDGHALEKQALDSASLLIYSSEWAAKSAITDYQIPEEKIKVIPFGANVICNRTFDDIRDIINNRSSEICKLLFLGVDWKRKGGDIVLATAQVLNEMGLKTEVHIVGIKEIPTKSLPNFVKLYGFLSKSTAEGRDKLDRIISMSHFLFLPSSAEAFGIVFSEASSFGLPSIATKTGGVPDVIKDNLNGMTFHTDASPTDYAEWIHKIFTDRKAYVNLSLSSFNEYQTRLNWAITGSKIARCLREL